MLAKRQLKVDLDDLTFVFSSGFAEMQHYLDLEAGQVILVTDEMRWQLEPILAACDTMDAIAAAIERENLPGWQREALHAAARVEVGFGSRYIEVPTSDSREGYEDMAAFIEMVGDERLRQGLLMAINGKGAFRRFKDVLSHHHQERERWFKFQEARLQQRVLDWLASEGIEPIMGDG